MSYPEKFEKLESDVKSWDLAFLEAHCAQKA
jgi:hypothetical protein